MHSLTSISFFSFVIPLRLWSKLKKTKTVTKSHFVVETFYCVKFVGNNQIFSDKIFFGLSRNVKKEKTPPQNNFFKKITQNPPSHKTHIPFAFLSSLFCCLLMLVLFSSSSSFAPKSDCFHMTCCAPKIQKLDWQPILMELQLNLQPILFLLELELNMGPRTPLFFFLNAPITIFFLFVLLCPSLLDFLSLLFLHSVNYWA